MFFGLELKEIVEKSKSSKLLSIFSIVCLCFSLLFQLSGSHGVSNFLARFFLFDQQNNFWAFFPNDRVQKDCWNNWYLSRNYFGIWSRCFFYKMISIFDEIFWIYLLTFQDRWSFDFSVSIFLSKSYSQLLSYYLVLFHFPFRTFDFTNHLYNLIFLCHQRVFLHICWLSLAFYLIVIFRILRSHEWIFQFYSWRRIFTGYHFG